MADLSFLEAPDYWLTRFCLQRALAFIYLMGFLIAANQFQGLCGSRGLLPARSFISRIRFWDAPSLFWFRCTDRFLVGTAWIGVVLSLAALSGLSDSHGLIVSIVVWSALWALYLSFVNIGQTFYGFGWETLLTEAGFLAIFLGSSDVAPTFPVIWLFRWLLFRVMFGAGMIKIRGDSCWRDLTCMYYHYETQPSPNPLSPYFHRLPRFVHKAAVLFNHFVELIVPWGYFAPGLVGAIAGGLTIIFQGILILSGNLSWLNYVTIVLSLSCFDDGFLSRIIPQSWPWRPSEALALPPSFGALVIAVSLLIVYLSLRPARNLFSREQLMNASFEPLHLVNTYGAFGSITKKRYEIIIEGTDETALTPKTAWRSYEFKAKPGDVRRRHPVVSPYHYRLDWQMWFAAMSDYRFHPWFLRLVEKLLEGEPKVLALLKKNPFPDSLPKFVRAGLYLYHFPLPGSPPGERWVRKRVDEYLAPQSLD